METYKSAHSHMSIICHDQERSYKGVYLLAAAVPFFVTAVFFIKSALWQQSHYGNLPIEDIKYAVMFLFVSALLTGLALRILKFHYHTLFDKVKGQFSHKKDNFFSTIRIDGELSQIREIYVCKVQVPSDRISREKRTLFKIGIRVGHQQVFIYISPQEKEALSMGVSLSEFLGVAFNQEIEDRE